jgi:hypothetical protein
MDPEQRFVLLRDSLRFRRAIEWLKHDAADDHFPDPIRYADLIDLADDYLDRTKHRRFNHFEHPAPIFHAPKPGFFLRDITFLPPVHRILYLAILEKLLPKLDPRLPQEVYSFRLDGDEGATRYPFAFRAERWKDFQNEFRRSALEDSAQAVLVGDIASYYDHISVDRLIDVLRFVLGAGISKEEEASLSLLKELLESWTQDGYGIPVNYDPSSFFSSVYLTPVDREMIENRYRYLRWADDIRLVATSKAQAIRGLHQLQDSLRRVGLYLSTAKTRIHEKGTPEYEALIDVADDVKLAEIQEALDSCTRTRIQPAIGVALQRMEHHAKVGGDDRKFRAFGSKIQRALSYNELCEAIWPKLKHLVLPRLETHPERSDWWVKLLSKDVDSEIQDAVYDALTVPGRNIFDWQRMYLWELLIRSERPLQSRLLDQAKIVARSMNCDPVAARAIILVGKCCDDIVRDLLFSELYQRHRSVIVKRAVLIAIQEMSEHRRQRLYEAATRIDPEQTELVTYLQRRPSPAYTWYQRQTRSFRAEPLVRVGRSARGIGKVNGQVVRFMLSRLDYDYE